MNKQLYISSLAIVLTAAAMADAGVGYRFGGTRPQETLRRFNFAVSETSPNANRRWTAEDFSGESLTPQQRARIAQQLRLRGNMGPWFQSFVALQRAQMRRAARQLASESAAGGAGGGGGGSQGLGGGSSSDEHTHAGQPFNAGYCYCPGGDDDGDGGDPGDGGGGDDDDDDDDDGGTDGTDGGDGDDGSGDGDDGGTDGTDGTDGADDGGPDPSVVPEPGSFALWALAGCLLVGVTRRKSSDR